MHPEVRAGYFAQANTARLDPRRSVLEELQAVQEQPDPQAARNVAGLMMFTADNALKPVEVLSGGEQCRVLIGRIILSPVNLLLLDEPTHHLDMESCEALAEAVEAFPGATIMVTHDERLLGRLATRLVVFRSGGASLFEGTYDQFLEERGWDEDTHEQQGMSDNSNAQRLSRKDERRLRAQRIAERSKKLKPLERQMQQLEQQIETLELEIHGHEQQLIEASHSQNASAISDLSQLMQQSKDRVWDLYEKLDTVMTEYEQRKAEIG
jgi:ATP-binding cassette subfamily F protein 3